MRDLAENLGILVSHRPLEVPAGTYNTRANGAHNTAAEIDLADYHYPRKMLVIVTLGAADKSQMFPFPQATLQAKIWSGSASGALVNLDKTFDVFYTPGEQIYEYETVRRYVNIECIVTNVISLYVDFAVVLVTDHARYGSMGSDD